MTELSRAAFAGESLVANMASKGTVVDVMLSCNMIVKLRQHSFGKFENDAHEAWPVVGAKRATALKPGPKIWTRGARNRKFPPNLPPTRICDSLSGLLLGIPADAGPTPGRHPKDRSRRPGLSFGVNGGRKRKNETRPKVTRNRPTRSPKGDLTLEIVVGRSAAAIP